MAEGKKKFIEDAARVIDGRVRVLEEELARESRKRPQPTYLASDHAAILEAKLCAELIRRLADGPYRDDPYNVAHNRWLRK